MRFPGAPETGVSVGLGVMPPLQGTSGGRPGEDGGMGTLGLGWLPFLPGAHGRWQNGTLEEHS